MVTNDYYSGKIKQSQGKTFTISQAREFEREMLKAPTDTIPTYRWINKNKQTIYFSY